MSGRLETYAHIKSDYYTHCHGGAVQFEFN
jgi:hypothetical protein